MGRGGCSLVLVMKPEIHWDRPSGVGSAVTLVLWSPAQPG